MRTTRALNPHQNLMAAGSSSPDALVARLLGLGRGLRPKQQPPPAGLADNQTIQISVYGPAQQMHALRLGLNDPLADLNTAVQRFGYDLGVDRLCRFGGAPLPRDDRLTLAESGLHGKFIA